MRCMKVLTKLVTKISKWPGTRIMTRNLGVKASGYANSTVLESLKVGCNWQKVGCNSPKMVLENPGLYMSDIVFYSNFYLWWKQNYVNFLGRSFLGLSLQNECLFSKTVGYAVDFNTLAYMYVFPMLVFEFLLSCYRVLYRYLVM